VVERIGPVRPTTFGRLFHVKVNPGSGPGSNAYTTLGLSPHTDLPTREYQPGVQFLHCLANAARGGAGVMVDGYAVAGGDPGGRSRRLPNPDDCGLAA